MGKRKIAILWAIVAVVCFLVFVGLSYPEDMWKQIGIAASLVGMIVGTVFCAMNW